MNRALLTIGLLILSNVFMTLAWYGHLRFRLPVWLQQWGLFGVILVSWGLAFFEYICQVPANKLGYEANGGPFNMWQLKVIQEVITLVVFTLFTMIFFKKETLGINQMIGFFCLVMAVYFIFKKS